MKALTVTPGVAGSGRLDDRPTPDHDPDRVPIEPLLVGVCGTDLEIVGGGYGEAPEEADHLVLGHESLARVSASGDGHAVGDLVVPIVRRPDPVPCSSCAVGEWDMCRNGRYTEHGIKGLDGFLVEAASVDADAVVSVPAELGDLGVLVEPASVVSKAWEQVERIGARTHRHPRTVLVTGAGPIGLLAALLGRQRGLDVHVLDLVTDGPKPGLVADLGAGYHVGPVEDACAAPDIVIECTGVGELVLAAIRGSGPGGIVCLTGISSGARVVELSPGQLNRRIVLENDAVFGSVNANRRHYEAAVSALVAADSTWLRRLITRRVPLDRWAEAFQPHPHDVKTVIEVSG